MGAILSASVTRGMQGIKISSMGELQDTAII